MLVSLLLVVLVASVAMGSRRPLDQVENPDSRSVFCSQCIEVEVSSLGGAADHQGARLGRFRADGAIWNNQIPVFKSDNGQWLTPDPNSSEAIFYLKWVIADNVGGTGPGIWNDHYTDGFNCPWDIPDQWGYEWNGEWFIDPTIKVKCATYRNEE